MKKHIQPIIIFFIVAIFISSPIILNKMPLLGVDRIFHYNRIYEAAMQIKHLNFSTLNLYSFQQSGRIVNALYSPFLTYVLGAILLIAGSWFKFQVILNILLLFVAGITTYLVAQKLGLSTKTSVALGTIYLTSNAVAAFIIKASWRSLGLACMPLMILPMIDMLQEKFKFKNALILALAVSLQIQGHLLSALFDVPVLISAFIIGFIKTYHKKALFRYLLTAIITTLILCLNSILPFLQISSRNILMPPTKFDLTNKIFNPFNVLTNSDLQFFGNRISFTDNTLAIMIMLGLTIIFLYGRKITSLSKILILSGLTYFLLGSNIMPWPLVQKKLPFIQHFLQFSYRFTIIGDAFVLIGAILAIHELTNNLPETFKKASELVLIMLSIISVFSLTTCVSDDVILNTRSTTTIAQSASTNPKNLALNPLNNHPVNTPTALLPAWHSHKLGQLIHTIDRTTPDYVPVKSTNIRHYYDLYSKHVLAQHRKFKKTVLTHGVIRISWYQDKNHPIEIPVFVYRDTSTKFQGQKLHNADIPKTSIGTLKLNGTKGKNSLTLQYKTSYLFKLMIIISVLSWFILFGYLIIDKIREKNISTSAELTS